MCHMDGFIRTVDALADPAILLKFNEVAAQIWGVSCRHLLDADLAIKMQSAKAS